MPYITEVTRRELVHDKVTPHSAGELNYLITKLILAYSAEKGRTYTTFNEVVGALECCKQEFYRRVVVPYEEEKRKENGDVY